MKPLKIIDLSMPITNQTPIYPGDPEPKLTPAATIVNDGFNVTALHLGSHTGTHVDAPSHIQMQGATIDEAPLHRFMGEGIVIDVTGKDEGCEIGMDDVSPFLPKLTAGKIALFHTGWSAFAGEEKYFHHPFLGEDVIKTLVERGIRTFFIDALNIDPPDGSSFTGHDLITGSGGIIGENFTNFDQIDFGNPWIVALPLHFKGLDGSPVRAVAIQVGS